MKAIRKFNIVFRIAILSILVPLFYLYSKRNNILGIAFIVLALTFTLLRLFVFGKKYKYWDLEESYEWAPLGYVFGGMLLFIAILASYGTVSDISQGAPIPLWAIVALSGAWIFGFLLVYYAYKSQKEFSLIIKKEEKLGEIVSKEKAKKFWICYLIVFMIIAAILRYTLGGTPLTLTNGIITIIAIAFMYFFLRIASPARRRGSKKKNYKVWIVISIILLIFFGSFIYSLTVSLNRPPSDNCPSRGIFPKNGIPGLQYCEKDSDCIKVINRVSCCDSCNGGSDNAINKKHIDFLECVRLKETNCSNYECEENVTSQSCFAQAGCVDNVCEIIEELPRYDLKFSDFECKQNQDRCYVNCTWKVYNAGNYPTRYRLNISLHDKELEWYVSSSWGMLYPEVPIYQDRIDEYNRDYNCEFGKEGFEYMREFTVK